MLISGIIKKSYSKYFWEIVRFGIVGCTSALCLYVVYLLLLNYINHSISYAIGYFVSFLLNYYLSVYFTFKVKSQINKFGGFALSHVINFCLQIALLNIFICIGFSEKWAPVPVLLICIPTNFFLVRFFLNR